MAEPVRLRLVFEDAGVLRGRQRRRGLQRCWVQVLPDLPTIADLASHVYHTFGLHRSCPHGLIVSMDGFVLPPFESTCILKDEDTIMIKKNGFMSKDVKFCGSENMEQVLHRRQTPPFNNTNLTIIDPQVDSEGDEDDMVLCNGGTVQMETPNEEMNAQYKIKRSIKLQGDTFAIKDSHGSLGDEEGVDLHGNMAHVETASNEMSNVKMKKKHSNKLQTLDSILANKDSQVDLRGHKGDLGLPISHRQTSSSEMIKAKQKRRHFEKIQGSRDTLAIKDSQGNSGRDEEDVGLSGNISHKEAASTEIMHKKHKRKHSNKLQASDTLTTKKSQGDSQGDEGDLGLPNGQHMETPCEMTNAKRKGKHSNEFQDPYDTLALKDSQGDVKDFDLHGNIAHKDAISNDTMNAKRKKKRSKGHHKDSQRDSPGDEDVGLPNGNVALTETPGEMTNSVKRKHSHKLHASDSGRNESKGNDDMNTSKNDANGDAKKVPSRSARRKKAKRLWHRSHGSKKKVIEIQIPESDNQEKPPEHANTDQNTDVGKDIARVIVCPGHFRFESSDTCSMRADEPVETLQWKGTTSKMKGQKWGRENTFNKWNDNTYDGLSIGEYNAKEAELVEASNEKSAVEEVEAYKEPIAQQVEPVKECTGNSVVKEYEAVKLLIDFERFLPLNRVPEEDDVLVYRVVELSSLWCPELSPFRVGRVSSYDCSSSKIILLPLPEYPLMEKHMSEDMSEDMSEEWQESSSLYHEDGTLEIDFPSLVDVRLFKAPESKETTPNAHPIEEMPQNGAPVNNQESASCSSNRIDTCSNHAVDDQVRDGWEGIHQALNEKKAQLQKLNNDLDKRNSSKSPTTGPWSYRALRRNALGPTLALLRNGDMDK